MDAASIVSRVVTYLDQHLRGGRGAMGQPPYRGDLFQLFEEAYVQGLMATSSSPRLTADGLRDILVDQWIRDGDPDEDKKRKLLEELCSKWSEWRYAWDRFPRVGPQPPAQEKAE